VSARARVITGGVVTVLLFDLITSVAARVFGFPYARASVGSYFIYLAVGFFAARVAVHSRARQGAFAAAVAGFADVSAGWAISGIIGPGRLPNGSISPIQWVVTTTIVVLFAASIGFLGGAVGARSRRVSTVV
jgi:hypothetical protein